MMHVHKVVYAITIARNCSWSLSVGPQQISRCQCLFLRDIPLIFSCVDQIVGFMNHLERSIICSGNSDSKFIELIQRQKGVSKVS